MSIPRGICAIVGGNGVGKSALLAAVSELLADPEMPLGVGHHTRLRHSELEGTVVDQTGQKKIIVREDAAGVRNSEGDKFQAEFHWLEPSYLVNLAHKQINEDANFSDLLEPLSPSKLEDEELEILRYLLGKKIDSCLIYEITEYGDLDPFPYFVAEAGGHHYGSERMGYGELALLFVVWKLRTIEKNSVLVLEEPEAHVSPRSQRALMDILAKACDERGLSIILTTHSPTIIAKLPNRNIILISKSAHGTQASIGPSKVQVNDLLGATTLKHAMVLVEDRTATLFALALVGELNFDLLSHLEVIEARGAANIDSILSTLPASQTGWPKVIGIYDGDMRKRVEPRNFNWPHLFLPGNASPEQMLRDMLTSLQAGQKLLATELHSNEEVVRTALDMVEGLDAHDWFTELTRSLKCEPQSLMKALVRIWLRDNQQTGEEFSQNIVDTLNLVD
ncbi:hypothetical protein GCM10027288_11760 [Bordetella tumbae]